MAEKFRNSSFLDGFKMFGPYQSQTTLNSSLFENRCNGGSIFSFKPIQHRAQVYCIPAKTVTIRRRPSDPWFDSECRQSKREVRRLAMSSRRLKTPEATAAWYSKRHEYRALLRRKRDCFWQAKIEAGKSKPCQLWRSIDALLGRGKTPLPADIDAAQFHNFFDDKVAGVRYTTSDAPHISCVSSSCFHQLRQLRRIRRSLDKESAATLVHAFVTSRVDYCNAVFAAEPRRQQTSSSAC